MGKFGTQTTKAPSPVAAPLAVAKSLADVFAGTITVKDELKLCKLVVSMLQNKQQSGNAAVRGLASIFGYNTTEEFEHFRDQAKEFGAKNGVV